MELTIKQNEKEVHLTFGITEERKDEIRELIKTNMAISLFKNDSIVEALDLMRDSLKSQDEVTFCAFILGHMAVKIKEDFLFYTQTLRAGEQFSNNEQ